ncbi:MAG: family 1 encapsulin nanocompartment shell protein [Candidatus Brocadiaceae bacterium]|jgi:uncharacterized linocin/CFP29 family protein
MTERFLHRDDAPFGDDVWEKIDEAVVGAARTQLSVRRILHTEGPYGAGLKSLDGPDAAVTEESEDGASVAAGGVVPVAAIRKGFTLPIRDIAAFERTGIPFGLDSAARAAIACAKREDEVLLYGSDELGVGGLLNADGVRSVALSEWTEAGAAAEDLIGAVTLLDEAGCHGPYALALTPGRYNLLFRRYQQGNMVEIEHLRSLITEGIVKAPALASGGVLVASGPQFATIVLGQDLMAGFVGPAGGDYEFSLSESVALRLRHPGAVCVLK